MKMLQFLFETTAIRARRICSFQPVEDALSDPRLIDVREGKRRRRQWWFQMYTIQWKKKILHAAPCFLGSSLSEQRSLFKRLNLNRCTIVGIKLVSVACLFSLIDHKYVAHTPDTEPHNYPSHSKVQTSHRGVKTTHAVVTARTQMDSSSSIHIFLTFVCLTLKGPFLHIFRMCLWEFIP